MSYTRQEIDGSIERRIITGLIVDDTYCRDALMMTKQRYFKTDYARRIFGWIAEYYKKYKHAPGKEIQSIFAAESLALREAEADLIETFLQDISDKYASTDSFNGQYLLDETKKFCEDRAFEILAETIEGFRLQGKLDKCRETVRNFEKIAKTTNSWFNPFDDKEVKEFMAERDLNKLFKLPGVLGEMMGWFEREWFVAIMGPYKRGKSFYSSELIYHALTTKLKIALFSLEMNDKTLERRLYKRLTAMNEYGGEFAYPVFDCKLNQSGACKKLERKNKIPLLKAGSSALPPFDPMSNYRPCDYCRRYKDDYQYYLPTTWWAVQKQPKNIDDQSILKKTRAFKRLYGNNLRVMTYPAFSAKFDDLIADLDNLEYTEGFVPDVILIDYIDILAREVKGDERADANEKWQRGKNLAGVRKALVINANQSNRDSIDKKSLEQKNTAEDIRKLAHVDALFTLNQTKEEKKAGVMRIETLIHRHEESTEKGQVLVLQNLKLGQPFLDSEWDKNIKNKEEEE